MCDWYEIDNEINNDGEPQDLVDLYDKGILDEGDLEEQLNKLYPDQRR